MAHDVNTFPEDAYRMTFTENHDKNSWEGTQYSNFGDGLHAAMILACTAKGMPLVYSGQEAGLDRPLAFFEKDQIDWKEHENAEMYRTLFDLKHRNQALWNGKWGGEMIRIDNDKMDQVLSFAREKNGDRVITILNFSDGPVTVTHKPGYFTGDYRELFSGEETTLKEKDELTLEAWGYRVLTRGHSE